MAHVKVLNTKKGTVYKITVSNGYDLHGKKIVKTTTYKPDSTLTPKQQEKALDKFVIEFEDKVKNGESFDGDKMSFELFAEKWLADVKDNLAYSTYEGYETIVNKRIIPYFKGYKVSKIKIPLIEAFYKELAKEYAYASVKKCDIVLGSMFKTAIRWGMIDINPCSNAKLPKINNTKNELKFFTPEQSLQFLHSLDRTYETTYKGHQRIDDTGIPYLVDDYTEARKVPTQYKVFFNIALFCGLRKGEILALHWEDIDFENNIITVNKSVAKTENGVSYKCPKTYTSIRTVPFPKEIVPLLKQYRKEYNLTKFRLGDYWKGQGNLFIQADGSLMGRSTPYQYFKRHLKRYNEWVVNSDEAKQNGWSTLPMIPLHGLRHSCATLLNYLDVNIIDISNILGHAQTSTTMNIYAHSFEEQKRIASDRIDEFLKKNA